MFSYRHSFHAGNHADVLKHLCQMLLIDKLKIKDKGFVYIDTHSGAGLYDLESDNAKKTNEFRQGIELLMKYQGNNPHIKQYVELISHYHRHSNYPGSPEIASTLLRPQDKLILMEWHNKEIDNLRHNLNGKNVAIHHRDGFEGLLAMTPPSLPRGMVLIDPSYEVADEYQQVFNSVTQALKKWSGGIIAIWYPLIAPKEDIDDAKFLTASKMGKSEQLLQAFKSQPFKNMLNIELCVTENKAGAGMYGSGMAIINAPWQFDEQIKLAVNELRTILGQDSAAKAKVEWLIKE